MNGFHIYTYGEPSVLTYRQDLPLPIPAPNQVRIKIHATSINPLDLKVRSGALKAIYGKTFPIGLGHDVMGTIDALGTDVKSFKVGDRVFAMTDAYVKPAIHGFAKGGTYGEYCLTRVDTLALLPAYDRPLDLAAVPLAALTAFQGLIQRGHLRSGQKVLINGASGGVGLFAVQIAKTYGAHVTAVSSKMGFDVLKTMGADVLMNYKTEDFRSSKEGYDLVFDVVANSSYSRCKNILAPKGLYISNVLTLNTLIGSFFPFSRQTYNWVLPSGADLKVIASLIESKKLRPYISKTYTLDEIPKAHELLEGQSVVGKVLIEVLKS